MAQGAQWLGTDDFPADLEWADEHEAWLRFIDSEGALPIYRPRLKGPRERRDEAFAEIAVAYFFATKCGMSIFEWEPPGAGGKKGEFLTGFDAHHALFVEVKSPGWEDEIARSEGRSSPRLQQPKYINDRARSTGPWASARHAVKKAYPKMPSNTPTMLVINDDLMLPLVEWGPDMMRIALYKPGLPGSASAEDGPFLDNRYARLGAVGVFKVVKPPLRYRFMVFENPHALAAVVVPPEIAKNYPRYDASEPEGE